MAKKKKHVLIQAGPPKESKMKEHTILPNPWSELPIGNNEAAKKENIFKDSKTGKLKAGNLSTIDKMLKGVPLKIKEED